MKSNPNSYAPTSPVKYVADHDFTGLTKREYFAAMAMQGILSRPDWNMSFKYAAQNAIEEADQLLKLLDNA